MTLIRSREYSRIRIVVVLSWAASVLPGAVQNLSDRRDGGNTVAAVVTDESAQSGLVQLLSYGLVAMLMGYCLFAFISTLSDTEQHRTTYGCLFLLIPWAAVMVSSAVTGSHIPLNAAAVPIVVCTLWRLGAGLGDLAALAPLTALTAAGAMVMGLIGGGLSVDQAGAVGSADKAILTDTLLAGPFNHPNVLGVILALGLPVLILMENRRRAILFAVVIVAALLWTSSRGSLAAAGGALLVAVVVYRCRNASLRAFLAAGAVVASVAAVVVVPLQSDQLSDFSQRGQIWNGSFQAWLGERLFGNGYSWYGELASVNNTLTAYAFNGHNLFVQALVTGGLVLALACALLVGRLGFVAVVAARDRSMFPLAYLVTFLIIAVLEVPTRFRDLDPAFWVTIIPMAVIVMGETAQPRTPRAATGHPAAASRRTLE